MKNYRKKRGALIAAPVQAYLKTRSSTREFELGLGLQLASIKGNFDYPYAFAVLCIIFLLA